MKRNVLIKGMKIVVALVVVIAIGLGATKGGMFLYNKGMFIYESILNKINDVNIQVKQINNKTTNTAGEIKDSLSDKGVRIKINNELINLDFKNDNSVVSVNTLVANSQATVNVGNLDGITLKIDGKEVNSNEDTTIEIGKLSKDVKIRIEIVSNETGDFRNYYLQTLPADFPTYTLDGKSNYDGDYLFNIGTYVAPFYIVQMNNQGEIVFYKRDTTKSFWLFQQHNIDGKIRYSYFQADPVDTPVVTGYHKGEVVVLDENYNEIDRVKLLPYGDLTAGYKPEGHDFYMIDDGHYILSAYVNKLVDNIPSNLTTLGNSTKVVASVLQEIKDGEVVWQWDSTNDPKLYELSLENNEFNDYTKWYDYAHLNSMEIDKNDNNIICSLRNLNAIVKLDRKTAEVIWILGGKGDEFGIKENQQFSRQHDANFLEDGRIVLFDNGSEVGKSRVLEFTIDEENKKIVNCEEFSVGNRFGMYMGSAQKIDDEINVFLIGWGSADTDTAIFTEYDFKNDKILSELHLLDDSLASYRVTKTK